MTLDEAKAQVALGLLTKGWCVIEFYRYRLSVTGDKDTGRKTTTGFRMYRKAAFLLYYDNPAKSRMANDLYDKNRDSSFSELFGEHVTDMNAISFYRHKPIGGLELDGTLWREEILYCTGNIITIVKE